MSEKVEIKQVTNVTHDVRQFRLEKPQGFDFEPGQATSVRVDKDGWREEERPFTFTSLPDWDDLEFTIKVYPDHHGVTEQVGQVQSGDALLIDEPWGTIQYRGPGTFIAGGAGVTPFIAILRALAADDNLDGHRLIFSNKTEADIILRDEFDAMSNLAKTYVLTKEQKAQFGYGRIDERFLEENISDFSQHFYVCGPEKMVANINEALEGLGAKPDSLVFEK